MGALWLYWLTGCVIVGLAFGAAIRRCPNDEVKSVELAATVAIWPVYLVATFGPAVEFDKTCKSQKVAQ